MIFHFDVMNMIKLNKFDQKLLVAFKLLFENHLQQALLLSK